MGSESRTSNGTAEGMPSALSKAQKITGSTAGNESFIANGTIGATPTGSSSSQPSIGEVTKHVRSPDWEPQSQSSASPPSWVVQKATVEEHDPVLSPVHEAPQGNSWGLGLVPDETAGSVPCASSAVRVATRKVRTKATGSPTSPTYDPFQSLLELAQRK